MFFPFPAAVFIRFQSLFAFRFKLYIKLCIVSMLVCAGALVCVYCVYSKIVPTDKIVRFMNTFIIIMSSGIYRNQRRH